MPEYIGIVRPNYFYCVEQGAKLAKRLGHERISVIEFGVAGGNGLIALERHAKQIGKNVGIAIDVYGFDLAEGLPAPDDYRDLPYVWQKGFFRMDYQKLSEKLSGAQLVIGDVRETSKTFFEKYNPAPIAAVMFDLDYYSSTKAAFTLFEGHEKYMLPRIYTYFDDIIGSNIEMHGDFMGELLAIKEFNEQHEHGKFCPVYALICRKLTACWFYQIRVLHLFKHKDYNTFVGKENWQLPLTKCR
jgi:hypothetical protein